MKSSSRRYWQNRLWIMIQRLQEKIAVEGERMVYSSDVKVMILSIIYLMDVLAELFEKPVQDASCPPLAK